MLRAEKPENSKTPELRFNEYKFIDIPINKEWKKQVRKMTWTDSPSRWKYVLIGIWDPG